MGSVISIGRPRAPNPLFRGFVITKKLAQRTFRQNLPSRSGMEERSYRDYYGGGGYSRDYRRADDQVGAYSDWDRSGGCCCGGGGYGGGSSLFSGGDGTLYALLAAAALAFYILYTTVTAAAGTGRRRRRRRGALDVEESLLWQGLEEFEEKIDAIAEGEDDGETSWISNIYNQFSFFNDGENSVEEADMEGLEPPLLDTTWGLGQRTNNKEIMANATIEESVPLNSSEEQSTKEKRSTDEQEEDVEEKCRVEMWRCFSKVIEGGLHYMDSPDGILSLAKKTMFKMAFHGGLTNMWGGLMAVPEARQIKQCMTTHTSCVSYEILRREAQQTMDPTDPMVTMYKKEKMEEKEEKEDRQDNTKEKKRERLIINPEFVEGMDTGDGSLQYDEDYSHNQI